MSKITPQTTVERISKVALKLLESKGAEAVTMRVVAQAVGITPMAIYHHFPNREALLQAITEREFDNVAGYIANRRAKLPPQSSPRTIVLELMQGYIDYAIQHPLLFDYMYFRERPGARRFPDDFRAGRSPTMNPLASGIEAAMSVGWLKKDDAMEVGLQFTALTHGYISMYRAGRFSFDETEFRACCDRAMNRMLDGLKQNNTKTSKRPNRVGVSSRNKKR